jgi:toxin ParE1/3/4
MNATILKRPAVRRELVEIGDYLDRHAGLTVAERFLQAAEETFAALAQMPGLGSPCEFESPHLQDIRSWPVKGFANHVIYYRPIDSGIEVFHVLRGSRDVAAIIRRDDRD